MNADVLIHDTAHQFGARATHPIELRCGGLAALLLLAGFIPRRRRALPAPHSAAHSGVFNCFLKVKNTLIILTSNIGSQAIMQACLNKAADDIPDAEALTEALRPQLYKAFKPAFLGRMKVVPYYPISDDVLEQIIQLKLARIAQRVAENHHAQFVHDQALVDAVLARCTEVDTGARAVDHILNGTLLPEIAEHVLAHMAQGEAIARIKVSASKAGQFKYVVTAAKADER